MLLGEYLSKAVAVFLLSSVKFFMAPFMAAGMQLTYGESVIYTVLGGMAGVWVFSRFSVHLLAFWRRLLPPKPRLTAYNPKLRRYIRLWQRFGLNGTAFLAPVLISIPLGVFLAVRFGTPPRLLYWRMFLGILFWGLMLGAVGHYAGSFFSATLSRLSMAF